MQGLKKLYKMSILLKLSVKTCLKCLLISQMEDLSEQLFFVASSITKSTNLAKDISSYFLTISEWIIVLKQFLCFILTLIPKYIRSESGARRTLSSQHDISLVMKVTSLSSVTYSNCCLPFIWVPNKCKFQQVLLFAKGACTYNVCTGSRGVPKKDMKSDQGEVESFSSGQDLETLQVWSLNIRKMYCYHDIR